MTNDDDRRAARQLAEQLLDEWDSETFDAIADAFAAHRREAIGEAAGVAETAKEEFDGFNFHGLRIMDDLIAAIRALAGEG